MSRWYIIHAYSGFEGKVRDSIMAEATRKLAWHRRARRQRPDEHTLVRVSAAKTKPSLTLMATQ